MNKCQWALNAFNEWKSARNTSAAETNSDISPIRLELVEMSKDDLCYSLMRFVLEVRNAQVTQWRGCYDDICEYRRTEVTSNLPEFAKKKRESVVT